MENEIEDKLLKKAKDNHLKILVVSKEGNYTFSSEGYIEDFDDTVISLDVGEVIKRITVIKIKILNGDDKYG